MVACFLLGELTSARFGADLRRALAAAGQADLLLTRADLADPDANRARRALLAETRGYGENRDVFEDFPGESEVVLEVHTRTGLRRLRFGMEYKVAGRNAALKAELDRVLGDARLAGVPQPA